MGELIITGDVEAAAVTFLRTGLAALNKAATVATKVPSTMPGNEYSDNAPTTAITPTHRQQAEHRTASKETLLGLYPQ